MQGNSRLISDSLLGILSKLIDALAKFFTIPMLIGYFGKGDYGLISLAFSLNAYLRLMDMGMNIGSIRFFSMWIVEKKWDKISNVSRSSIVFYGGIGLLNTIIFILLGIYSEFFFSIDESQVLIFKYLMFILAFSTVFNWTSSVVKQLLIANDQIAWVNKTNIISSVFIFGTAVCAIYFKLSLPTYFLLYILATMVVIPLNIHKLRIFGIPLTKLLVPRWFAADFKIILNYSLAIFAMGFFQFSADNLRPILLGRFASKGVEVLTEYRVIQTITAIVIAFGGVFIQTLLPHASKLYASNDTLRIQNTIFTGTKYISAFLGLVVFGLIASAEELLNIYVGPEYTHLTIWLQLWLVTVYIAMHNSPVASLILASGKTRFLVISSGIACIITIPITIFFANTLNVGAAVIGYLAYVILVISAYYFYYIPFVLKLEARKIFINAFLPSLAVGVISYLLTELFRVYFIIENALLSITIMAIVFAVIYLSFTLIFTIRVNEFKSLIQKLLKKR
ncbi:O-antigen/teichoic acid export membrane protein [Leeuwenhoekiella aestuarii]|uniref:lipopolysaccharide biosynthesis protein n=1 Tax=Leeuwenhoekiella aestuarii TaxID=2249426 RepID=UPI000FFED7A8|nr:hypothetical protein [Leeuwenhoekiella aestuarii]RXG12926.1 O-antigen/teichoic acid export membrane protein [Leeuwenhoekiella aestuarii]